MRAYSVSAASIRTPNYEVHAEKDGAKSPTRQVSSFDNRKEIVLTLKPTKRKIKADQILA